MVHLHKIMKGKVSEKVVLKEEWSMVSGSFTQNYEGEGF